MFGAVEIAPLAAAALLIAALLPRAGDPVGQWPLGRRSLAQQDTFGALARWSDGTAWIAERAQASLEKWQHLPSR
jgi:hypothetical protein